MPLPSSIQALFNETYDGMQAAKFKTASEAMNLETNLKWLSRSYRTKIVTTKKHGREFVVMLLEQYGA